MRIYEAPDEPQMGPMRLTLKEGLCNMSNQFFYVQLKFTPKTGTRAWRIV
jgi:hypothetical protein